MTSIYEFTYFDQLPTHKVIRDFVESKIRVDYDDLMTSDRLTKIISKVNMFILHYLEKKASSRQGKQSYTSKFWGMHAVTVRLNLIKQLLVYQLCIPYLYRTVARMGTIETLHPSSLQIKASPSLSSPVSYKNITERAKAIIIEAFSLFLISEESVIDEGKRNSFYSFLSLFMLNLSFLLVR
jgi:hypothetical protein